MCTDTWCGESNNEMRNFPNNRRNANIKGKGGKGASFHPRIGCASYTYNQPGYIFCWLMCPDTRVMSQTMQCETYLIPGGILIPEGKGAVEAAQPRIGCASYPYNQPEYNIIN